MKNLGLIMLFSLCGFLSFSQSVEEPIPVVTVAPSYVGGTEALTNFLNENLKYPKDAVASNASGKVYVLLTINAEGKIVDVEIIRGLANSLDTEAIRVCEKMPNWNPGRDANGLAIKSTVTLPIAFDLD